MRTPLFFSLLFLVTSANARVSTEIAKPVRIARPAPKQAFKGEYIFGRKYVGRNLRFIDATRAHFWTCDFTRVDAQKGVFTGSEIIDCIMRGINLTGARFSGAHLNKVKLDPAEYKGKRIPSLLDGAWFDGAKIIQVDFSEASLKRARFVGATFGVYTEFNEADLQDADFTDATFIASVNPLRARNVEGATFEGAVFLDVWGFSNADIKALKKRGAKILTGMKRAEYLKAHPQLAK